MTRRSRLYVAVPIVCAALWSTSAFAQSDSGGSRTLVVLPYIEVSQILSAELSPGDDVVTYTQLAAGADLNAQGRNSGVSVSIRYERNIGYGDRLDSDTISGIARGHVAVLHPALALEAGALASRTRADGGGAASPNPLALENAESRLYSIYAGPSLAARMGAVEVTGIARVGYSRFEADTDATNPNGSAADVFDDSVTYNTQLRAATRPGDPLPVGLAATAGVYREDISNLDQRVRDAFVRADVTVPLTQSLALVAGAGYEDVEISNRDALLDANGAPLRGPDGRFLTDKSSPRILAFDVDGLLWDVGVLWRPSSRTSLAASVGRRYDSTTYYGSFSYRPSIRSALTVNAYDGVSGFGGRINNALADLSSNFEVLRNPVTGDFAGLVTGEDGSGVINAVGSVRSAAFRGRGINASYQLRVGRLLAAIGAGYDRREFIGARGTVLEAADGLIDENYYVVGGLSRDLGRSATIAANAYVNWFESAADDADATSFGASAAYNRALTSKLSARAAIAIDYFDSEFTAEDFATATALLGLRYNF